VEKVAGSLAVQSKQHDALSERVVGVERKTWDLEDRSKRNNLLFYGVQKKPDETTAICEATLKELFADKLGLAEDIELDRAHRVSNKPDSPLIARCTFYKDKIKILKARTKLKGSDIFISEDFSRGVREVRKKLNEFRKIKKSCRRTSVYGVRSLVHRR
jgi:hypothetical protein